MTFEPSVLLTVDYEPWAALLQAEYNDAPSEVRRRVDDGYTQNALDEVLAAFDGVSISIFLVGEVAHWYPDIPARIAAAGHELGFHGHAHRPILGPGELQADLQLSADWLARYNVSGYRAPIIHIDDAGYAALDRAGFAYSSSVYAPTGVTQRINGLLEVPVSTWRLRPGAPDWWWPRNLSPRLLMQGEFPYGSSFFLGLLGGRLFYFIEKELKAGRSPVLVLHNYQIAPPPGWPRHIRPLLRRDPRQRAYVPDRSGFVSRLIREFPIAPMRDWVQATQQTSSEEDPDNEHG